MTKRNKYKNIVVKKDVKKEEPKKEKVINKPTKEDIEWHEHNLKIVEEKERKWHGKDKH